MQTWDGKFKPFLITVISVIYIAVVGYFDYLTGPYISFSLLYLVAIVFITWFIEPVWLVVIPLTASVIAWFFDDVISPYKYNHPLIPYWNVIWKAIFFLFVIYILRILKSNTKRLSSENERYSALLGTSIDGFWVADTKGRLLDINDSYCRLTGYSRDELLKMNISDLEAAEEPEDTVERIEKIKQTGADRFETRHKRKDGEIVDMDISVNYLKAEDKFFVFLRDITERKKAEDVLRASEESCRAIFESANDAIVIRDIKTYKIVDVNDRACEMFCYPKEEMMGLGPGAITADSHQYSAGKLKEFYDGVAGGSSGIFEWFAKDKFGREFWVEISAKRAVIGGQYRLISVARDITERRQMIETRESFMNMVSHELRTPLSAIKEAVSLAISGKPEIYAREQKELLAIAKRNIDRLGRLINQVLDFQKLEASMMEFNFDKNDANEVVKDVNATMARAAAGKKLTLTLKLDNKLPMAKFDRDKIVEVLTNLTDNAIKYTEKGGIVITTERQDNYIKVSVSDTGSGIKQDDVPKLFQRFSQLQRKAGGSGLGLAISKEIIEKHGGKIWAESERGKGAVFHFLLPVNGPGA